jgi:hypothetical protein
VESPNLRSDFRPLPRCLRSGPIINELFYFKAFRSFDRYYRLSAPRSLNFRSASTLIIVNQLFTDCPETSFLRETVERVLGRASLVVIIDIISIGFVDEKNYYDRESR